MSPSARASAASTTSATTGSSTAGSRAARAAPSRSRRRPGSRATRRTPRRWPRVSRRELGSPPWLFVERKGPSVAFHVRQADDIPAARAAVLAAILAVEARDGLGDHGLEPYRGRSVVDLRPRDAGGKGEAAARLIAPTRRRRGHLVRRRPERHGRLRCRDRRARRRAAGGGARSWPSTAGVSTPPEVLRAGRPRGRRRRGTSAGCSPRSRGGSSARARPARGRSSRWTPRPRRRPAGAARGRGPAGS